MDGENGHVGELTQTERIFCAAFGTTARRDPHIASIHAGLCITRDAARQMLARPAVRAELERISMQAEIAQGRVIDVKPIPITKKHGPVSSPKAARAFLERQRQAHLGELAKRAQRASGEILASGAKTPKKARDARVEIKKQLNSLETEKNHKNDKDEKNENPEFPATPLPPDERATRRALRAVEILTKDGEVAGTLKETVERLARARRGKRKGASATRPDSTQKNPNALKKRLEELKKPGVAHEQANGALTIWCDGDVATRYEVKKWLTAVMTGRLTHDVSVRMQAAALLGKSLGMFDAKMIEREREIDDMIPTTEEDVRKEIEKTKLELVRLKA